jgi:hypothetical protein
VCFSYLLKARNEVGQVTQGETTRLKAGSAL